MPGGSAALPALSGMIARIGLLGGHGWHSFEGRRRAAKRRVVEPTHDARRLCRVLLVQRHRLGSADAREFLRVLGVPGVVVVGHHDGFREEPVQLLEEDLLALLLLEPARDPD